MKWMMYIGVVAMLAGCDASKDELQSTKTSLEGVTHERDNLKAQVMTLQRQLDEDKANLVKAKATAAATKTPAPADANTGAAAGKAKHGKKS